MEQFDQLLTCAICLDRYRIPKLLPCQHSFCMEPCMEGLVNYITRQVKCPECRAEHRIPYQGVQAYPTNVTLQRFLELHIEITGELPDPTSGQIMERCNVCSEKNYCTLCSHCDKKVCTDCKEGHLDILRREIARVNNQVRRTLHRLQDALCVIEKNSLQLQQNCASITEEVDDIYRRLSKALKERTEYLKSEVEVFLAKEMCTLTSLKENLEQEILNFESNSDFAEKNMGEGSTWEDNELMDTKDILLRTMEFIRNFECEPGEYHRRVRFAISQDPNQLAATLAGLGELTINSPPQIGSGPQLAPPTLSPGLMRSKSDHRVAAQFRQAEERYLAYGSDNNEGRTSPVGGRRYFGDRSSSRYGSTADSSRRGDYDYDSPSLESSDSRRPRFRSRFMRHLDSGDSDNEPSGRSVRFHEQAGESGSGVPQKKEREKVLDTEDATRGPLSGITKLLDSPRVISRIHEMENKDKKKDKPSPIGPSPPVVQSQTPSTPTRRAGRQVSEEDEISKIKKQNKAQETSAATAETTSPAAATQTSQMAQRKTSSSTQPDSHPSTPTSTERPRFPTNAEKANVSRQTSTSSTDRKEDTTSAAAESDETRDQNQRRRPVTLRSQSQQSESGKQESSRTGNGSSSMAAPTHAESNPPRSPQPGNYGKPSFQGSTSSNTSQDEDRNGSGRTSRIGRLSADQYKTRSTSSDGSTSTESSTHSSPVRNTGAAFSTEELRNRYARKSSIGTTQSPTSPTASVTTTEAPSRSRYGTSSSTTTPSRYGTSTTTGSASNTSSATATTTTPRFQSRFLGRPGTPTAEASRESESSSSSSEDSSESESESDREKPVAKTTRDKELARTDIGPLLARSAHARDTSSYSRNEPSTPSYSSKPEPTTSYARNRGATATLTSPPSSTRPTPSAAPSRYGSDSTPSSSRYGTNDYLTPTALSRSRTGSTLHAEELENKYPLASKYLNRSRANMGDSSTTDSTPVSSRYGGYRSRFLNKSKSSAALASDKDGDEDRNDQDDVVESENGNKDDRQVQSRNTSSNLASGEERYPSGRSRYAALKDRRSRLARSRSSHEMSNADEPFDLENGNGQCGEAGDTEASSSDRTGAGGTGSSLSTWARYLKSKYGPRNKEDHQEDETNAKQRSSRARSTGSAPGSRPWSPSAGENEDPETKTGVPDSPTGFGPRHQYMQKRKVQFKFGNRGSEKGAFTWPRGVAVGPDNTIVIADSSNHRVQVFDANGRFLKEFGHYGSGEGEFDCLAGVAVNRIGQYIIADRYNHRIQVFDPSGRFLRVFGSQGSTDGKFSYPWGVTTDALGFIYVCDKENHRVQVFQSDGTFVGKFGSIGNRPGQLEHPHYIAVSCTNRVIVSDSNNHRIQVFDVNGRVVTCFGSEGSEEGQFKFPRGVSVDDQGYIVVADSGNNRIQIFSPEGVFLKAFGCWGSGDGEFKGLEGIAVLANGNIVVCDRENHRIQVF